MIEEKDILAYLDGNSSIELQKKVEGWISESPGNEEEFEFTKMMWEEAVAAKDYVRFDTTEEWATFEKLVEVPPLKIVEKPKPKSKVVPLKKKNNWQTSLSIAASFIVLIAATWFLWPQSEYIEIVNSATDQQIILEDGSIVNISEGSNFKTKRSYKYETLRNVDIAGEVNFNVASNPTKAFIVSTEESAVEVLGTIFNVKTEGVESEVSNEEGLVKFFVIEDPTQFVTLEEGEVFRYDGTGFVDMKPVPVVPPPPPKVIPKVKDIIDYLKTTSRGRVTFGSSINENSLRELDIDYEGKTVREVIALLEEKARVIYLNKGCPDCLQIMEIIPRRR